MGPPDQGVPDLTARYGELAMSEPTPGDGVTERDEIGGLQSGVILKLLREGVYTWTISAAEGGTLDDLRAAKERVVAIAKELEKDLPNHAKPKKSLGG